MDDNLSCSGYPVVATKQQSPQFPNKSWGGCKAPWRWIAFALISIISISLRSDEAGQRPEKSRASHVDHTETIANRNTAPGVAYLGSQFCVQCHQSIAAEYVRIGMGKSMSLSGQDSGPVALPVPATVVNKNKKFEVFRQGGDLYQSICQLDQRGREVFRHTEKIEFEMGSGVNGIGFIVRKKDYLFQAPLAFYTKPRTWGLSPGYENFDFGFSRPVRSPCLVCHSGRPQPIPNRSGLYKDPIFHELSIGCENCHGPGQLHVEERLRGDSSPNDSDTSIVNPAKLPMWLAVNICMYCHQDGDARVLKPGKDYLDFRPGTPLDGTVAIFRLPPKGQSPLNSFLLDRYSEMIMSKCYRASGERFGCLTCHNIHHQPSPENLTAFYRTKCLNCHTDSACRVPLQTRQAENPANDCAECHMPKQAVEFPHTSVTNHRVVIRPGEPYLEFGFGQTALESADLIHLNAIPTAEKTPIPPIILLQAYQQILEKEPNPIYEQRYSMLLDQLSKAEPNNPIVLGAMARKFSKSGTLQNYSQAIDYLEKAIRLGSMGVDDYLVLAELLRRSGRISEANKTLQHAIILEPYNHLYFRSLAVNYLVQTDFRSALQIIEQGLQLFPEDSYLRNLQTQAKRGELATNH